jgi:hypothetical protein
MNFFKNMKVSLELAKAARQGKTIITNEDGSYYIIINR